MQVESVNIGKNVGLEQKNAGFMVVAGVVGENWPEIVGLLPAGPKVTEPSERFANSLE